MEQKAQDFGEKPRTKKATTTHSQSTKSDMTPTVKHAFPIKRFGFACLMMLVGLAVCIAITGLSPLNPYPNNSKFNITQLNSWLYPIERNGMLRIPLINTRNEISALSEAGDDLGIRFSDGQVIVLDLNGSISTLSQADTSIAGKSLDIVVEDYRKFSLSEVRQQINLLFDGVESNSIVNLSVSAYVSQADELQLEDYERLQQQQVQQELPTKAAASEPEYASSINPDSARKTSFQIADMTAGYIRNAFSIPQSMINIEGLGIDRHRRDSAWIERMGPSSGIFIQVDYQTTINLVEWRKYSNEALSPNTESNWLVSEDGEIVFDDSNASPRLIAILPKALDRSYGRLEPTTTIEENNAFYLSLSPQRFPSPISLIVLALFSFFAFRLLSVPKGQRDTDIILKQKLVDSFVSDAPANDLTQDRLGFVEISSALSRFLRNAGTKAPLTLAITGVWGSGKSSLMYFIKQNLESYRLHPVWVNAWHHQNEEQFLAGLLSAIQNNAIPRLWTPAGVLYRWNLLRNRWAESPVFFFISTTVLLASLGYLLTSGDASFQHVTKLSEQTVPFIGALFGAFSLLRGGMDRISGMINTSALSAILRTPGKNLDLRSNVGLREKFAKEFKILCDALGDSTLTIFIDDLDRCKEQRIMDVMETINYLVSSGDCFIVLGMEKEPIEKAIAAYYSDSHSELDTQGLEEKAKRYLEKIINIEIPVPSANADQCDKLIDKYDPEPNTSRWEWLKPLMLVLFSIISITFGSYLASVTINDSTEQDISEQGTDIQLNQSETDVIKNEAVSTRISATEDKGLYVLLPFVFILVIGLIIRVEKYRQRKRIVEQDSQQFLDSISVWAQALGVAQRTPRSIKRYVNRARYLAMRNIESGTDIREDNLVTLAALLEFTVQGGEFDSKALEQNLPQFDDQEMAQKVSYLLHQSDEVKAHKKQQFIHWISGINMN